MKDNELKQATIWIEFVDSMSLSGIRNRDSLIKTANETFAKKCPLPIILTLCPAIINLDTPNDKGQTRKLSVLPSDNTRLMRFVEELVDFNAKTVDLLGSPLETFLVFADVLERGAGSMFTNVADWQKIASESVKNIVSAFVDFDKRHPGLLQTTKFRTPKVRLQSNVLEQAGKAGLRHEDEVKKFELMCLDPKSDMFDLFIKHIKSTGDTPFVATGFQTIKSAETVWNRVRFMLSQNAADGIVLPKIMAELHKNQFASGMPRSIFVCSTTRRGGIESEMDGFTFGNENSALAIFKNIGSWMKEN